MCRVLNICLNGPYTDGFSYQDNLLPKYQKRAGCDVTVLTNTSYWDRDGVLQIAPESDYITKDGVRVIRISPDNGKNVSYRFKRYSKLIEKLNIIEPDIVFLHGCQSFESATVEKYVKAHTSVRLYVDNHADSSNSGTNPLSKYFLHKIIWRHYARKLIPYTTIFWGTLPARIDFLVDNYGIPREKCALLTMGGDDDQICRALKPGNRRAVRNRFGCKEDDFLIVTGGKIDSAKRQTIELMAAVSNLSMVCGNLKLIVFGPVSQELQESVDSLEDGVVIQHLSWADESLSYDLFSAADLAVFPGRHSVYWEQAASLGLPLVVKYWDGTDHININGNAWFLHDSSEAEITQVISNILSPGVYDTLKSKAEQAMKHFRYSNIALRSIELGVNRE